MSSVSPCLSYHDVEPLESGGVVARKGFIFQDHVAAGYCIQMLHNTELLEVWCETLDDITLVRRKGSQEEFEFVQVKSNEFRHFWSISELCKREKTKGTGISGSSILEKSLAYERGKEPCRFRIVTCLPVNTELKVLTLPLTSPRRNPTSTDILRLSNEILKKIPNYTSPNGSDTSSWISRTEWDVCHSIDAVENKNRLQLRSISSKFNIHLVEDQWDELYRKILKKVQDAGMEKWEVNPASKKMKQSEFLDWIKDLLSQAQHPGSGHKGSQLREKMEKAGISNDAIERAQEQRRAYRMRLLNPSYMELSRYKDIEMDTQAHLSEILAKLDAGKLDDTGVEFHHRCLDLLSTIRSGPDKISLSFLHGYMYHLADRCVYRFTRVTI